MLLQRESLAIAKRYHSFSCFVQFFPYSHIMEGEMPKNNYKYMSFLNFFHCIFRFCKKKPYLCTKIYYKPT